MIGGKVDLAEMRRRDILGGGKAQAVTLKLEVGLIEAFGRRTMDLYYSHCSMAPSNHS